MDNRPEQVGTEVGQGCIDRDFDGIPDEVDACPDAAGLPEDGCPAPSENDQDGDGFLDNIDACPDEAGSSTANGCVDTDGDSFADSEDECPLEPGLSGACPSTNDTNGPIDEDGDGVLDSDDACPSTAGSVTNGGCPDMGGVLPPPPTPEDDDDPPDEGGILDDLVPVPKAIVPIEIEAYSMYIRNDYESVRCYLDVNDSIDTREEPYDFESNGTHYWDIAAQLDGENGINTQVNDEEDLIITLKCLRFKWGC